MVGRLGRRVRSSGSTCTIRRSSWPPRPTRSCPAASARRKPDVGARRRAPARSRREVTAGSRSGPGRRRPPSTTGSGATTPFSVTSSGRPGAAVGLDEHLLQAGRVDLPADVGARLADHEGARVAPRAGLDLQVPLERQVGQGRPERRVVVPMTQSAGPRTSARSPSHEGRVGELGATRSSRRRTPLGERAQPDAVAQRVELVGGPSGLRRLGPVRRQVEHDAEVGHPASCSRAATPVRGRGWVVGAAR